MQFLRIGYTFFRLPDIYPGNKERNTRILMKLNAFRVSRMEYAQAQRGSSTIHVRSERPAPYLVLRIASLGA